MVLKQYQLIHKPPSGSFSKKIEMKLFVLLAVVALSNGAKLDRTYLPPSYAQTSGGSGNFLQTPVPGPSDYQRDNGLTQTAPGSNRNSFAQSGNEYTQNGNGFSQNSNDYSQNGNDFDQNGNNYAQNGNDFAQNGNDFTQGNTGDYNGFNNFESRPERAQAAFERNAAILRQDNQNDGETYAYAYETENGIIAEENGVATNGVEAQGGFSYTGDDGQVYSIRYTADQNGFVPQGDHLPTPPPIPEEIQKALEQNARDEAAGIFDDGSYNEAKYNNEYENSNNYGNANNANNYDAGNNYNEEDTYNGEDEDTIVTNNALFRSSNGPAVRNQGFAQDNGFNAASQSGANGVENAYLPPFSQRSGQNGAGQVTGFRAQGLNKGPFRNQADDVNQAYLPPFAAQRNQASVSQANSFRAQRPNQGFGNQASNVNDVEKAYLAPFASQKSGQNNQAALLQNQATGFRGQGFGNQPTSINGVEKAYIPPFASQRAGQNQGGAQQNQANNFGARVSQRFEGANANGVEKAYLPPFANQRSQNTQAAPGFRAQSSGVNKVNNAYLPPFGQRSGQNNERNGVARRPSFNDRTGYQY